ncbi:hypothetical protein GJA_1306 [Janthinobacterium agaricidamnosum NBRC 102515 = DSM 9628]|uniref:Uncharacterized protein n=1 Tax=Janthinobacterium agaricidamnosum NBRC 102515 = DSM 9628 TaxID=1349767 RepID=W0UZH0_9BURK|nr:hypothetical protein GJA_1306 [Janthinobacterium agaricidamnosum NBRC 102515 = DSM 9628]
MYGAQVEVSLVKKKWLKALLHAKDVAYLTVNLIPIAVFLT